MKIELNPNYAYNLSELNDNELKAIGVFFLKNKHESQSGCPDKVIEWLKLHGPTKTFVKYFDSLRNYMWAFGNDHKRQVINAKTLFENKTESENEKPIQYQIGIDTFNPQPHYNNENGSLYKIATDLGLNHWEFDIFKRLVRCRKKNQFKEDLQKIKDTIDIYLNEYSE